MADEKKLPPSPEVWPEAKPYWEAAAEGRLLIKSCRACGEKHFYPRPFCPFCMSDETEWQTSSGRGSIYSYTVGARAPFFPITAMIALEEGPVMMSAIVDADPANVAIGGNVQVTFTPTADGQPIPVFQLI